MLLLIYNISLLAQAYGGDISHEGETCPELFLIAKQTYSDRKFQHFCSGGGAAPPHFLRLWAFGLLHLSPGLVIFSHSERYIATVTSNRHTNGKQGWTNEAGLKLSRVGPGPVLSHTLREVVRNNTYFT